MREEMPEATRAGNDALRAEIESMLASYERDSAELVAAQQRAVEPVTVWSDDNLVRVTANVTGVIDVHLEPEAFKRSTPATLGATVTATIQEAARRATSLRAEALDRFTGSMPDLPDLVPGAPSAKDLLARLTPPAPETVTPPPLDAPDDDEDAYFRNRDYLR
ncbi:YbaB/EbfC family nucleoid-associated protein [Nocardia thailandica]